MIIPSGALEAKVKGIIKRRALCQFQPPQANKAEQAKHSTIFRVIISQRTDTAQTIARSLAARPGPIIPFIAETGGINAMIVDSSALAEQ